MKRKILIPLLLGVCTTHLFAQSIPQLKIGDKVPDVTLAHILNYKTTAAKLSDFKDKLIILDFWATWCGPCLKALPELDSLQKKYKDALAVIAVTKEPESLVEKCFNQIPSLKKVNLPIVYSDTTLSHFFPTGLIPHEVVIKNGFVYAITGAESINVENIGKVLSGESVKMYEQITKEVWNYEKPFFMDSTGQKILLQQRLLTGYLEGQHSQLSRRYPPGHLDQPDYRIMGTNDRILDLFRSALLKKVATSSDLSENSIILNTKEKERYVRPTGLTANEFYDWDKRNLYCYDYIIPLNSKVSVYDYFKEDIEQFFDVKIRMDEQVLDCYVLKVTDSTTLKAKGKVVVTDEGTYLWTLKNIRMDSFYTLLNARSDFPIVNETNLGDMKIDLSFKPYFHDLPALAKEFLNSGLDLVKDRRLIRVMVVEDN